MEMLIVVVIIGILAAAILPRLQGAQAATRDAGRIKSITDLTNALEMYYTQKGAYPGVAETPVEDYLSADVVLKPELVEKREYLKDMPKDPTKTHTMILTNDNTNGKITTNDYGYVPMKRNATSEENSSFILVAKVETFDKANATDATLSTISVNGDITALQLCDEVVKKSGAQTSTANGATCEVNDSSKLYYIFKR